MRCKYETNSSFKWKSCAFHTKVLLSVPADRTSTPAPRGSPPTMRQMSTNTVQDEIGPHLDQLHHRRRHGIRQDQIAQGQFGSLLMDQIGQLAVSTARRDQRPRDRTVPLTWRWAASRSARMWCCLVRSSVTRASSALRNSGWSPWAPARTRSSKRSARAITEPPKVTEGSRSRGRPHPEPSRRPLRGFPWPQRAS